MTNRDLFRFLLGCAHRALEVAQIDDPNDDISCPLWDHFFQHNADCLDAAEVVCDLCSVSIWYL